MAAKKRAGLVHMCLGAGLVRPPIYETSLDVAYRVIGSRRVGVSRVEWCPFSRFVPRRIGPNQPIPPSSVTWM